MQSKDPWEWIQSTKAGWLLLACAIVIGYLYARASSPSFDPSGLVQQSMTQSTAEAQLRESARPFFALVDRPICRDIAGTLLTAQTQKAFQETAATYARACIPAQ